MIAPEAPRDGSAVTRWLRTAPPLLFALYGGLAAFGAYFAMYAYRKPFTAADYLHIPGWHYAVDYKIMLVIAQVAGYALSKFLGIKVISELPSSRRAVAILLLVGSAELTLVLFGVAPPLIGVGALFANGLCLGMIWGLVFGFLEGRCLSEVLGAMLCASFILSSGVVKSAGKALMLDGVAERWMPAATGLMFAPLLLISVAGLAQLPPPNARDERERVRREPMDGRQRASFLHAHAGGMIALVGVYILLTMVRDFRDNFANEIWQELGYSGEAGIFTWSELPVAIMVLIALGMLIRVRDNRHGFFANLGLVGAGLLIMGAATLAFQSALLSPVTWMIALGAGLYLAYTPFNALLFDRLVAASGTPGTAGFLIYVADAGGYAGSVVLLLLRNFARLSLPWSQFLCEISYITCLIGLVATGIAVLSFARILRSGAGVGAQCAGAVHSQGV
jgi:hypothetical protein